ncbi:MAG: RDD family protein [bacterium]
MQQNDELEYAGFWIRVWASIIDTILLMLIMMPILLSIYGIEYMESEEFIKGPTGFLVSWVLPAIAIIIFWIYKSATPGKMAISSKIVDAQSGSQPTTGQFIGRYLAYFIATLPLGLGIIWVAFDKRKQGWHDKLAGTVVVRKKNTGPERVVFENKT